MTTNAVDGSGSRTESLESGRLAAPRSPYRGGWIHHVVVSAVIAFLVSAGPLYALNWWLYYDSQEAVIGGQHQGNFHAFRAVALADLEFDGKVNCERLSRLLATMRGEHTVSWPNGECDTMQASFGRIDPSRTVVELERDLGGPSAEALTGVLFRVRGYNRPPYLSAIWRASTCSLFDERRPARWKNRSIPLYAPMFVIFVLLVAVFRLLDRITKGAREMERARTEQEAERARLDREAERAEFERVQQQLRRDRERLEMIFRAISGAAIDARSTGLNRAQDAVLSGSRTALGHLEHRFKNELGGTTTDAGWQDVSALRVPGDNSIGDTDPSDAWMEVAAVFSEIFREFIEDVARLRASTISELRAVLEANQSRVAQTGHAVTVAIDPAVEAFADSHECGPPPYWVSTVIRNLLDNSVRQLDRRSRQLKMQGAEGRSRLPLELEISLSIADEAGRRRVVLRVADAGGGFPPEVLGRVFHEPIPSTKGTVRDGLGTYEVGSWVHLFEGTITATNEIRSDDTWAVVEIRWPLRAVDRNSEEVGQPDAQGLVKGPEPS